MKLRMLLALLGAVALYPGTAPGKTPRATPTATSSATPATPPGSAAPGSAAPGGETFEMLLATATPIKAEALARSVTLKAPDAPPKGSLVAVELPVPEPVAGESPTEIVVRVPAELYVPAYLTRIDPKDDRSPLGPMLTTAVPKKVAVPDFKASMSYTAPGAPDAASEVLAFSERDKAVRFMHGVRKAKLRVQLILRVGRPWRSKVRDTYKRTVIDEEGTARAPRDKGRGKGPRIDAVVGAACSVVGYRIFAAVGTDAGKIVASVPSSGEPHAAPLVVSAKKPVVVAAAPDVASPATADRPEASDADEPTAATAPAPAAAPAPAPRPTTGTASLSPDADLDTCRSERETDPWRALLACRRVMAVDMFDTEATELIKTIPRTVSRDALILEASRLRSRVTACLSGSKDGIGLKLLIAPDGAVLSAEALPPYDGTGSGRCVEKLMKMTRVPAFAAEAPEPLTHTFPPLL